MKKKYVYPDREQYQLDGILKLGERSISIT